MKSLGSLLINLQMTRMYFLKSFKRRMLSCQKLDMIIYWDNIERLHVVNKFDLEIYYFMDQF